MAGLVDQYGRPMDKATVASSPMSMARTVRPGMAGELTPHRLASTLRAIEQGQAEAYLELADRMEDRDLHYRSVLDTRKLAAAALPITVRAVAEDTRSVEIAEAVRQMLTALRPGLLDMFDAISKGVSIMEIDWDTEGKMWHPRNLIWQDPRQFDWPKKAGLPLLRTQGTSMELPAGRFLVCMPRLKTGDPLRRGLAYPVTWAHMFKTFTLKDWQGFLEVYGQPLRLGKYLTGASAEDKEILLRAVTDIGIDAAAIVSADMDITFVETTTSAGGDAFRHNAEFWNNEISKLVLGQNLTTEVKGGSRAAATVHNDVRHDRTNADGMAGSETLIAGLVRPFVQFNWGPDAPIPEVEMRLPEEEQLQIRVGAIGDMVDRGLEVDQAEVRQILRLKSPEAGASLMRPSGGGRSPSPPAAPDPSLNRAMHAASNLDAIDLLVAQSSSEWQPMVSPLRDGLLEFLATCTSLEDARDRLAEALPLMDVTALGTALGNAGFVATLAGRLGLDNNGTPGQDA
jgi:phage gp29-like protein